MQLFVFCFSGGDDFDEVDEDENIDELDQQEVRVTDVLSLHTSTVSLQSVSFICSVITAHKVEVCKIKTYFPLLCTLQILLGFVNPKTLCRQGSLHCKTERHLSVRKFALMVN